MWGMCRFMSGLSARLYFGIKEISKRGFSSQFQDLQTKDMLTLFSQYEKLRADLSEGGREAQYCSSSSRTQEGGPDYHC